MLNEELILKATNALLEYELKKSSGKESLVGSYSKPILVQVSGISSINSFLVILANSHSDSTC